MRKKARARGVRIRGFVKVRFTFGLGASSLGLIHDVTGPRVLCKDGDHNPISVHPIWPCRSRKSARISPFKVVQLSSRAESCILNLLFFSSWKESLYKTPNWIQLWRMNNVKLVSGSSPSRCFPVYFQMCCLDKACEQTVQPWDGFDTVWVWCRVY